MPSSASALTQRASSLSSVVNCIKMQVVSQAPQHCQFSFTAIPSSASVLTRWLRHCPMTVNSTRHAGTVVAAAPPAQVVFDRSWRGSQEQQLANERRHCAGRKQSDCGTRPVRHASIVRLSLATLQRQYAQRQVVVRGLEVPSPSPPPHPSLHSLPGASGLAHTIVDMETLAGERGRDRERHRETDRQRQRQRE